MELYDFELELQSEIVRWKCSRHVDCLMRFIPKPRHIKLGMSGLVWSIQALPLHGLTDYTFNIMAVKRSRIPLALSEATTAPDLPAKFKLLLVRFEASMKSVTRAEEAVDKFYAFSGLFFRAQEDNRWWIIADAEITAAACKTAREATQEAAEAAAGFLEGIEPLGLEKGQQKSGGSGWWIEPPPAVEEGQKKSNICGGSGWAIEQWTTEDELWATIFFSEQSAVADRKTRKFQATAVEEGNVLQWCSVHVLERLTPSFEFEVFLEEFLRGDDVILRIGVANNRALKILVFLTENDVRVDCSQEGVEPETSLGLGYLLPHMVRDYLKGALQRNEAEQGSNNVVQGLLRHVVRYLVLLKGLCMVCGSERLLKVPPTSTCGNICRARKQGYEDVASRKVIVSEGRKRREQYLRMLYSNTDEGRLALSILVRTGVVEKEENKGGKDGLQLAAAFAETWGKVAAETAKGWQRKAKTIAYSEAVRRVAKMSSASIATELGRKISELWRGDVAAAPS